MQNLFRATRIALLSTVIFCLSGIVSFGQCTTGCTLTIATNISFTVASGQTVCLAYTGVYNKTINLNGGTLCIAPGININGGSFNTNSGSTINNYGSISIALNNFNSGYTLNNYGTFTGSISQGGGAVVNYSGGTFNPSSVTLNSGSLTNNAGGNMTMPSAITVSSGYTLINNGTASFSSITINSGATVNLSGIQTITGNVANNNSFTLAGPSTIGGTFTNNGGTANFSGNITVSGAGTSSNTGTINLSGNLTVSGSYNGNGSINETHSGCNAFTVGTNSGTGTFNGGQSTYGGGLIVNSASGSATLTNGASGTLAAPSQQATSFTGSLSTLTVSGGFTSPSASIANFIVLRYIGLSPVTDTPVNYSTYSVGSTIGSSTVAAIVTGGSTGAKSFSDVIPGGNCGKNIYYRIFSSNGAGQCKSFDNISPLLGTVAIPSYSTSITASGPTTFCAGGSVTLAAATASSYAWSTGATTVSISATASATYTVIATNNQSCTASASQSVIVNTLPTPAVNNPSSCPGANVTLTATGGTSYTWNTGASGASITVNPSVATTYTVVATNAANCTASASGSVSMLATPSPTVNNAVSCSGAAVTLTATGGTGYLWSTGATTASITTAIATTYTVTASNSTSCTASISGTVTAASPPALTPSSNSPIAAGSAINLTVGLSGGASPYTYSWSGPSAFASTIQSPSVAIASGSTIGTYAITVTDNKGCTASGNTIVTLAVAPGGMATNMALWIKANSLSLSNGVTVPVWTNSAGGNNVTQPVALIQPTYYNTSADYINYYPVVKFDGATNLMTAPSFSGTNTYSQAHIFAVAKSASSTQTSSLLYEGQAITGGEAGRINVHLPWSGLSYWDAGTCCSNNRLTATFPSTYVNVPKLWSYSKDMAGTASGAQKQDIRINGLVASSNTINTTFTGNSSTFNLGGDGFGDNMNGEIAEVIYYLGASINAAAQNKIESYLALKYGITLDQTTSQNYTNSSGLIMWNATANGAYNKNIFGVAIDNGSGLSQAKSQSINTTLLSIAGASGLTNNSALVVADNGGTTVSIITAGLPYSITEKINIKWRASQTGTRTSANYIFDISTATHSGYFASIAAALVPYMLIDSNADGTFESFSTATSVSGTAYVFPANLPDGALFTFGFKAPPIDYGDAFGVPTTIAANGAGHVITAGVYLGSLIDAEADGIPSVNEAGDDTIGLADEDGVNFNIGVPTNNQNILQIGITNSIQVTASTAGYLNAWIDYDKSNTYDNNSEYALINVPIASGTNVVSFNISDSIAYGSTSMRFRFSKNSTDVTGPTGLAPNGEVEDYKVFITAPLVGPCTNGFQNPSFEMGPGPSSYTITNETNLPFWRTTATDRQVEVWYTGFNSTPAYQGNYFVELEANLYGALYQDVYTTPGTTILWHFAHRGRNGNDTCTLNIGTPANPVLQTTVIDGNTAWGVHTGSYIVPANQYITRFAFNAVGSYGGNQSVGNFIDDMYVSNSFDFGDAPNSYSTLKASNGPYHAMTGNLYLGTNVSCDADGQPNATAATDSYDDGVTFPAVCNTCSSYTVSISVYNNSGLPATIAGWIDFNKNGVFDATERVSVNVPSSTSQQTVSMTFNTTLAMLSPSVNGQLFARFRIANDSTEISNPTGLATSGEVEDYLVPCSSMLALPVPSSNTPVCTRSTLNLTTTTTAGAYYFWRGPNGFSASGSAVSKPNVQLADSGLYRVYSVYANGCETDSAITRVAVSNCYVSLTGSIFDDANGNGLIDGTDASTSLGQTIYAILTDNSNTVLSTALIASNGTFTIANAPAYLAGMNVTASTASYAIGSVSAGPQWPTGWAGTLGQYGSNNGTGSGTYTGTNQLLPVTSSISNILNIRLGFDQLPTSSPRNYSISYPTHNAIKPLTTSYGMGALAGSDAEDGTIGSGQKFTITSIAGLNGNTLFYDLNGNGVPDAGEQITGYTTITNFTPSKLMMKFTGAGSTSASFYYGATDAASRIDPAPALYLIHWTGTLPVQLLYFTVEKHNETEAMLKWATATEINNDHFEIERSADAQHWTKIDEVTGNGNTYQQINYSLPDKSPLTGTNYYRLKQVDYDDKYEYSNIAEVQFTNSTNGQLVVAIYPNPVASSGILNIELNNTDETIKSIIVRNAIDQLVYSKSVPDMQSDKLQDMHLAEGVYLISVNTNNDKIITSRLVIQ